VVYLLAATGAVEAMRGLERLEASRVIRSLPLAGLILFVTINTAQNYFGVWGQARDVRVAYHTTLAEIARYLDRAAPPQSVVAVSSIYPNRFHDPDSMALMLRREDLSFRWFTGSFVDASGASHASLVFPRGNQVWAVTQSIAPIDPAFAPVFDRYAEKIDTIDLRPDDFNPRFEVYRFEGSGMLSELMKTGTALTYTVEFGHAASLIGYDVRPAHVKPGETIDVITYWRIAAAYPRELVLFTHALTGDPNRPVLAQQDVLDVPAYHWVPGDAFAQVHRFVIPPDAKPGTYPLEVGLYTRDDGARLTLGDGSDHVIIGSIEVIAP
jgi:hypothetical protein